MRRTKRACQYREARRGFTIMELALALFLLAASLSLFAVVMIKLDRAQCDIHAHRIATLEASNLMGELLRTPWESLAGTSQEKLRELRARLPLATCQLEIDPPQGSPEAMRIHMTIEWTSGGAPRRVRLVGFRSREP